MSVLLLVGCDSTVDDRADVHCDPDGKDAGSARDSGRDGSEDSEGAGDSGATDGSPAADARSPGECDEPACCLASGYCIEAIPDGATLTISGADSVPELPADLSAIGDAVDAVLDSAGGAGSAAVITLPLPEDIDPSTVIVWFVAEGERKGVPATIEVSEGTLSITVRQSGTYVSTQVVITAPCDEKVFMGDVSAQSDIDLEQLEGVTTLKGSLSLGGATANLAPLACLTVITGSLSVSGASELSELELGALAKVGSRIIVTSDPALTAVRLPGLRLVGSYGATSLVLDQLLELTDVDVRSLVETPEGGSISITGVGLAANGVVTADGDLTLNFASLTTLRGSLELSLLVNLKNVDDFSNLRAIRGGLSVTSNPKLVGLEGFGALGQVGGRVVVRDAALLKRVDFQSLKSVGSYGGTSLLLSALPKLQQVDARSLVETPGGGTISITNASSMVNGALTLDFASLETVRGKLELSSLANLEDVDGFSKLRVVKDGLSVTGDTKLVDLHGFGALEEVGGQIMVRSDTALQSVDLRSLKSVGSYGGTSLLLDVLPALMEVDLRSLAETPERGSISVTNAGSTADGALTLNFGSLTTVRGSLDLSSLANLEGVDGFSKLRAIEGGLIVTGDSTLVDLHGFGAIEEVGGSVEVTSDAALKSVDFRSLTSVGQYATNSLLLDGLPELMEVDVRSLVETRTTWGTISITNAGSTADGALTLNFASLTTLGGSLALSSIANLAEVNFASLTTLHGKLSMSSLANLKEVNFAALTTLHATLELSSLANAESVDFASLTRLGGSLTLQDLPKLSNVTGFGALETIAGMLSIRSNAALTTLAGLGSLTTLGSQLTIVSNVILPTCEADQLRDRLVDGGYSSTATISGNVPDSCGG